MHKLAARWIVFAHDDDSATFSNPPKAALALRSSKLSGISQLARKLR
jgi:hypothetical protein